MKENKGWICVHRKILDHFLWQDKPYSKGQAWIDLLLMANHEDKKTLYQGQLVEFKKGTVNRSILSLAQRWGWDRKKVRKFLDVLEIEEMATTNSTTHGTTITIINYGVYQDVGTTKRTATRTTEGQPKDNRSPQTTTITINDNKKRHGSYRNVILSDEDLEKLKKEFPSDWAQRIETLSEGIAVHGYQYKNHLAAIRRWSKTEKKTVGKGVERNLEQRKDYEFSENIFC